MAKPVKTAQGTWRMQIEVRGRRESGTFATRREALEWAAVRAVALRDAAAGVPGARKTLLDALRAYGEKVSPTKRGEVREIVRLVALPKHPRFPGGVLLAELTPAHLAAWRDARLALVSRGAVLRDMVLVGHVLEVARREWGWLAVNPMRDVRKPAEPDHRERIIAPWEVRRMLRALGWRGRAPVRTVGQAVAWCFIAALQTGMRAGELCGLTWGDVRGDYVVLHAGKTKTGKAREVPLSPTAQRAIAAMRGFDDALVFGLKSQTLDAMFRKYRARAGLEGFVFHDARHSAATRLAPVVDVLTLCKIFGWENATRALTYYNPRGSELARRLAGR